MLKRYIDLEPHITLSKSFKSNVFDSKPTKSEHRDITALEGILKNANDVSMALQKETCTITAAKRYFEALMSRFDVFREEDIAPYLSRQSSFPHSLLFETGIAKLQEGAETQLSGPERDALAHLKLPEFELDGDSSEDETQVALSLVEEIDEIVERQSKRGKVQSKYTCVNHVPPTSNMCERLFSQTKLVIGDRRSRMLPVNLEITMFLKLNFHLWDAKTVHLVLTRLQDGYYEYADDV